VTLELSDSCDLSIIAIVVDNREWLSIVIMIVYESYLLCIIIVIVLQLLSSK